MRKHWEYVSIMKATERVGDLINNFLVFDISSDSDDGVGSNVLSFQVFTHVIS